MKRKNKIIILSTIIFLILITLILITYGYYLTKIKGNINAKSITASIAYLELTYNDGNGLIEGNNIIPGDNITTKTFSVENTGNKKVVNYVVYLEDVINTFEDQSDLKLTLDCTSSINSNCMGNNTIYPDNDTLLVLNDIEVGEIQTYELKVDFIETYDDQSDNMNKIIEGNIVIKNLKETENSLETESGTDSVMLDNSKLITNYRIYGNSIQNNLPDEYQEVEYIESTGTQYIDTGYYLTNNSVFELDYQLTEQQYGRGIYGAYTNNSSRYEAILRTSSQTSPGYFEYGYYDNFFYDDINQDLSRHIIKQDKEKFYYDGILMRTFTNSNFKQSLTAYIGYLNISSSSYTPITGKIYSCKIYDNDKLVRDFIPCYRKSDNVIGLYDAVNGVFYTNAGTGTFTKGNNVTPTADNAVEIQSVGDLVTDENNDNYGKYKIPVTVIGKNLFDTNNFTNTGNLLDPTNGYLNTNTNYKTSNYILITPGTYTLSLKNTYDGTSNTTSRISLYNLNNTYIGSVVSDTSFRPANPKYTFTITNDCYYRLSVRNTDENVMIEKSSTATTYEPYFSPTTTNIYLDEPLRKVGDYADYIYFKNKKIVRNVEVIDNTGTLKLEESLKGLTTPTEETIDLPTIPINEETNIIEINTNISPSRIDVEYVK